MENYLELSDRDLINLYYSGNDFAFKVLYCRYSDKIYHTIKRLIKNKTTAEDIFQEVNFKVIKSLQEGRYDEQGKFLYWVIRIARNFCIDYLRKDSRIEIEEIDCEDKVYQFSSNLINADSLVNMKELNMILAQLINELPVEQADVIFMRIHLGLKFKEIALITNCSTNTALGRMRYALLTLKKRAEILDGNVS